MVKHEHSEKARSKSMMIENQEGGGWKWLGGWSNFAEVLPAIPNLHTTSNFKTCNSKVSGVKLALDKARSRMNL